MSMPTQKTLNEALDTVSAELMEMFKKDEAEKMAKSAIDDAPAEASEGSAPPAEPDAESADAGPPSDGPPVESSASADGPPGEASPEASAPPEGDPALGGQDQGPQTVEELQPLYMQMGQANPELLKAHMLACQGALTALMGADQGAPPPGPEASAPPMAPPAAPPGPPAPMAMSEKKLGKSEADFKVEALEKELKSQTDELAKLAKVMEVVLTPIRKSVKGVSDLKFINRTEEVKPSPVAKMTKSEINGVLREKIREGKLSKKDKDLVLEFSSSQSFDTTKIEHLLVAAK